jgi:peroxiredoxin
MIFKKKTIVLECLLLLFAGSALAQQDEEFTLTVHAAGAKPTDKAFLIYKKGGGASIHVDSVPNNNNTFVIKGSTPTKQRAVLFIAPGNTNFFYMPKTKPGEALYLEAGSITMDIGAQPYSTKIGGTKLNEDFQEYYDLITPYKKQETDLEAQFKKANDSKDTVTMTRLQVAYQKLSAERNKVETAFFYKHLDSQVSLDWLYVSVNAYENKPEAQKLFNSLSERLRNSYAGKMYASRLSRIVTVEVGDMAPAIAAKNPEGKEISLSSFRGKYVLVDFWASWCGPCRRENPNVVKTYKRFKSKKFDILGVSLDTSADAWKGAIAKDGLTWPQVSDLAGWQSGIASTYVVRAIPANFLIDPDGKVIAKNLRGDSLVAELTKVLGDKK